MKNIIIALSIAVFILSGCESGRVKRNRDTYKKFLYEMSDNPEFLQINSEKVKIADKHEIQIYFYVDFETRYCDKILKDKVEFYFMKNDLVEINGRNPLKYKSDFLLNILK